MITIFKYLLVMLFMIVATATVSLAQRLITVDIEGKPTKVELVVNDNRSDSFKAKEPNRITVAFEAILEGDSKGSSRISIFRNVVTGFIYQNGVCYAVTGTLGQGIKATNYTNPTLENQFSEIRNRGQHTVTAPNQVSFGVHRVLQNTVQPPPLQAQI